MCAKPLPLSWTTSVRLPSARLRRPSAELAPESLEASLKEVKAKDAEVRVQLQADAAVNYGQVAKAMASIERSGISKISVMTTH